MYDSAAIPPPEALQKSTGSPLEILPKHTHVYQSIQSKNLHFPPHKKKKKQSGIFWEEYGGNSPPCN